jgi:hypothetical protein
MALMISSLVALPVAVEEVLLIFAVGEVVLGESWLHFRRSQDWEFC